MKSFTTVILFSSLIVILWTYSFHQNSIHAVTMTANLNPDSNQTLVNFNELHASLFTYPQNSKLDILFKQLPPRITMEASSDSINNSTTTSAPQAQKNTKEMNDILSKINSQFAKMKSIVNATNIKLRYIMDTRQISDTQISIAQRINMDLTLENYVIQNNNDPIHKLIDLNWRNLKIDDPILLEDTKDQANKNTSNIDINHLLETIYSLNPEFRDVIKIDNSTSDSSILDSPLVDFSKLSLPVDKWYVLFDPAASLAETAGYKFQGEENGARAVTIYSLGEGSIREGKHEDSVFNTAFGDNNQYKAELTIPAPNARIDILGYSKMSTNGGDDTAIISQSNEGGSSYAGNFPFVVLGGFGAIMGVVVVIVLLKSRKSTNVLGQ